MLSRLYLHDFEQFKILVMYCIEGKEKPSYIFQISEFQKVVNKGSF